MKLQFEPYVVEPFNDFYKFPHEQVEVDGHLIYQDYHQDLACLQRDYARKLSDMQRYHQQRIADLQHQLFQDLQK